MNEFSKCFFCIMWFFPFPLLMWSNTLIHGTFIFARPFGRGRSFFLKSATELADSIAYGLFRFPLLVQFFQAMPFSDFIQNPFILGDPVCWCVTAHNSLGFISEASIGMALLSFLIFSLQFAQESISFVFSGNQFLLFKVFLFFCISSVIFIISFPLLTGGCFSFLLCFLFPVLRCADMRSQACEASAVR